VGPNSHINVILCSSPNFLWNAGGIALDHNVFPILDILLRSGDIRDQSLKFYKIARNFACFAPPHPDLLVKAPKFLDLRVSDHVTKFHGNLPRALGVLCQDQGQQVKTLQGGPKKLSYRTLSISSLNILNIDQFSQFFYQ